MTSNQPHVAIIDWAKSPLGDPHSTAERAVIGAEPLESVVDGMARIKS